MGAQKNRLNETVLLSTQNISKMHGEEKNYNFYAQKCCLSKPVYLRPRGHRLEPQGHHCVVGSP